MNTESFPGADGKDDGLETDTWVADGEARLLLSEKLEPHSLGALKEKLHIYLQDETIESVTIYCNRTKSTAYLKGLLVAVSRQNQPYGKRLLLRGINHSDEADFVGFGWEIEGSD